MFACLGGLPLALRLAAMSSQLSMHSSSCLVAHFKCSAGEIAFGFDEQRSRILVAGRIL